MKPSIGQIVLFQFPAELVKDNFAAVCPAVITRVWSDACVNLHLLRDAYQDFELEQDKPTSVSFDSNGGDRSWRWPHADAVVESLK